LEAVWMGLKAERSLIVSNMNILPEGARVPLSDFFRKNSEINVCKYQICYNNQNTPNQIGYHYIDCIYHL